MKKLKKLSTIVAAAGILGFTMPAFAAEQKYDIPKHDLKDATKEIIRINQKDGTKYRLEIYTWDRNNDGKIDLCKARYYVNQQPMYEDEFLDIDDDFDGYIDRTLIDDVKADGTIGADGIYDEEVHTRLNMDLAIMYMRSLGNDTENKE